jgi:hypothetical protein
VLGFLERPSPLGRYPVGWARIEANSMIGTYCYFQSGYWSSVMPRSFVEWLPPAPGLSVSRLIEPKVSKTVGLVIADRAPVPALLSAFWHQVERYAPGVNLRSEAIPI